MYYSADIPGNIQKNCAKCAKEAGDRAGESESFEVVELWPRLFSLRAANGRKRGLKSDLNRGFWGNSTLKPDWALPALATTEATHGNAITPLVTQLLMDQGKAWGELGQGINRYRGKLLKTQLLFKI